MTARTARLRQYVSRHSLLNWFPLTIVFIGGVVVSFWSNHVLRADRDLVVHSHYVIESGQALLLAMADAETGQRGYLITGEQRYLEPFDRGRATVATAADRLDQLVSDNLAQHQRIVLLRSLVSEKLAELDAVIQTRKTAGFDAASAQVSADTGKKVMDALRVLVSDLDRAELAILAQRQRDVRTDETRVIIVSVAAAILSFATRFVVGVFRRRREKA